MGRRAKQRRQELPWIAHTELPRSVAHPFDEQLNRLLEERSFDDFVERESARFYAERMGRPSPVPGSSDLEGAVQSSGFGQYPGFLLAYSSSMLLTQK